MVRKVKVLTQGIPDVDFRVFAPQSHGQPYVVEIFKDRYTRRVSVDYMTSQRLDLAHPDPGLMRDLRTAVLSVRHLAQRAQSRA